MGHILVRLDARPMKDSQDWLVVVTGLYADYYANKITLGELSDGVNSIVREHFLKEALEMIDSTPKLILKGKFEDDMGLFGDYVEVAELRNKFNDKYKED